MEALGGIGIGLVWGWLIGGRRWSLRSSVACVLAAVAVAAETAVLAGLSAIAPAVGAIVLAATLRAAWRYRLGLQGHADTSVLGTESNPRRGGHP